jgi:hypothetical protein
VGQTITCVLGRRARQKRPGLLLVGQRSPAKGQSPRRTRTRQRKGNRRPYHPTFG